MKKARILLAAGILGMPFVANAQDGIASAATAPLEGQFQMIFEDGTVAVADYSTQRVYITKANGLNFEVTFADAIAIEPDPVKREALSASFRQSLVDPTNMLAIRRVRVATDSSYWPKPSTGNNPPSDTNVEQLVPRERGKRNDVVAMIGADSQSFTGPFGQCWTGPCSPNQWPPRTDGPMTFYSALDASWDMDSGGGGNITRQNLQKYDRERWEISRSSACAEKNAQAGDTMAIGAATVATCALAETGIGAIGCAAGIVAYGFGLYKTDKANKQCQAGYPGLGKW